MTDLRKSKQEDPELQRMVDERKKRVNKVLSDIKQGKRFKEVIIRK